LETSAAKKVMDFTEKETQREGEEKCPSNLKTYGSNRKGNFFTSEVEQKEGVERLGKAPHPQKNHSQSSRKKEARD